MENKFSRSPAPGAVVLGQISEQTVRRIAAETGAEPDTGAGGKETLVFESGPGKKSVSWKQVSDIVGGEAVVLPILKDNDGHRLLPTGRIEVRFKEMPDNKQLAAFAQRHALELIGQNRWNGRQASFALSPKDQRFLLDVTQSLESDSEAAAAWPDTRSAFQRAEK